MRTTRCSLPAGVSGQGVSCPGGVWQAPPCEQNDWQTGVKILPCRNLVADGKNRL